MIGVSYLIFVKEERVHVNWDVFLVLGTDIRTSHLKLPFVAFLTANIPKKYLYLLFIYA